MNAEQEKPEDDVIDRLEELIDKCPVYDTPSIHAAIDEIHRLRDQLEAIVRAVGLELEKGGPIRGAHGCMRPSLVPKDAMPVPITSWVKP